MTQVAWIFQGQLLRQDELPLEWCPWHMHFYCPTCGEVWLKRVLLDNSWHAYVFKGTPCLFCPRPSEYWGLPANILNGYEQKNGYHPLELLSLEYLSTTAGISQWTQLLPVN